MRLPVDVSAISFLCAMPPVPVPSRTGTGGGLRDQAAQGG
jgi:hypothetical protein